MLISSNKLELDKNSIIDLVAKGAGVSNDKISFISTITGLAKATEKTAEKIAEKTPEETTKEVAAKEVTVNNSIKILNFLNSQKYYLALITALITMFFVFLKKKNSSHSKLNKILAEVSNLEGKGT